MARRFWWGSGYYPPAPPKRPPPAHGIKVKKFGATWWGQRWIEALERFGYEYAARLGRGRSYARQGRVHDLEVEGGMVRARVTGSRPVPYEVTIRVAPLTDRVWKAGIKAMAARAVFTARLLAGEMPQEIDEAFRSARSSLFPERAKDLATDCTCPDWANPCKHVAAVHYVLGEAFDRDPFLLFELRGRSKDQVLAALRRLRAIPEGSSARGVTTAAGRPKRGDGKSQGRPGRPEDGAVTVTFRQIASGRYDHFHERTDDLRFHIGVPATEAAVLRQLGAPPSWSLRASPMELLYPAVAGAAALARELALGEAVSAEGTPAETPTGVSQRRQVRPVWVGRRGPGTR